MCVNRDYNHSSSVILGRVLRGPLLSSPDDRGASGMQTWKYDRRNIVLGPRGKNKQQCTLGCLQLAFLFGSSSFCSSPAKKVVVVAVVTLNFHESRVNHERSTLLLSVQ
jgi:hypothetical protein